MDGITILNTIDVYSDKRALIISLMFFIAINIVGIALCINEKIKHDNIISGAIIMLICFFLGLVFSVAISNYAKKEYVYTQYEVLIDDSVNLKEFNEKYEIIDQRGEIYTIKEK